MSVVTESNTESATTPRPMGLVNTVVLVAGVSFTVFWFLLPQLLGNATAPRGVLIWWTSLCSVGVVNIYLWYCSKQLIEARRIELAPDVYAARRRLLWLALIYLLGCFFRSLLPRTDGLRWCLVDSWLSTIAVGRTVATVAELCFAAQWAILLREYSRAAGIKVGALVSYAIVPMIVIAEIFSWHAVLTTYAFSHAVEETIWTVTAQMVLLCIFALLFRTSAEQRPMFIATIAFGIGYVAFMLMVDVPMYVDRWIDNEVSGKTYLTVMEGFADVWNRRIVMVGWENWRPQMPWMSLYFTLAVWASIGFAHAPTFQRRIDLAETDAVEATGSVEHPVA